MLHHVTSWCHGMLHTSWCHMQHTLQDGTCVAAGWCNISQVWQAACGQRCMRVCVRVHAQVFVYLYACGDMHAYLCARALTTIEHGHLQDFSTRRRTLPSGWRTRWSSSHLRSKMQCSAGPSTKTKVRFRNSDTVMAILACAQHMQT